MPRWQRVAAADDRRRGPRARAELLGKRGPFATFKTSLGALATVDEKRAAGQAVNEATVAVTDGLSRRRRELAAAERLAAARGRAARPHRGASARPRRGHAHLVTQAWERLEDVFIGLGFQVAEGPEVETDWYNFEALNMPPDHPAREHVRHVLRRPRRARLDRAAHPHVAGADPRRCRPSRRRSTWSCPAGCSAATPPTPPTCPCSTRSKAWSIDRDITLADLAGTIEAFTKAFFGADFTSRLRPELLPVHRAVGRVRHPARPTASWLELGGCGMVHPNVLRAGGLDPEEWSGFAFGFGIDRMAKERHGVGDLRDMFTNDIRFLEQF